MKIFLYFVRIDGQKLIITRKLFVAQIGFEPLFDNFKGISVMKTANEMHEILMKKSVEDSSFRSQLLADPKKAINDEFGIVVPDNMSISVHESDLQSLHLALPPSTEMNEEQLEAVSAGLCCCGV